MGCPDLSSTGPTAKVRTTRSPGPDLSDPAAYDVVGGVEKATGSAGASNGSGMTADTRNCPEAAI